MKTRNEWINQYVKWGWSILPIMPGLKRPAVASWVQYQKRKPTKEELQLWFEDPTMGVGVVTGAISNLLVVDEDSYKENGIKLELETPLKAISGSGGRHLYFRYSEGIGNAVNHTKSIDIRGEGGFIVLPPTIHPNGETYRWESEVPENLESLPALDASIANEIAKTDMVASKLNISDYLSVDSGGRNDSLHRVACAILNKHPEAEAIPIIMGINQTYSPPLPEWEIKQIIDSAKAFVKNNPKKTFKEMRAVRGEDSHPLKIISFDEAEQKYNELMTKYGNGITTGFELLDTYFKFLPTQLYMVSAATHIGKCFGKGTRVLMFDGTIKNVEDIVVGDTIMGDDSTPRNVLSLANGNEEMYLVKQSKGDNYTVNKSHVLCLKETGRINESRYKGIITSRRYGNGGESTIEVSEYLDKSKTYKHTHLGYRKLVEFKSQETKIDPYFLGIWLGDGNSENVGITTQDKEVVEYLDKYAGTIGLTVKKLISGDRCPRYSIAGIRGNKHSLQSLLREENLLNNKHIPNQYFNNSRDNRLALLAGLLDSDGYYSNRSKSFEFVNKNKKLMDDFCLLARSLGFVADYKNTTKSCQNGFVGNYYRVNLRGDCSIIPTKIVRKMARKRVRKDDVLVQSIKLKPLGVGKYYGFIIDGSHKFLLGDCTVAHNTTFVLNMAGRIARAGHKVIIASLEQNVFVIPRLINMFGSKQGMENISFIAPDDMPTPKDFLDVLESTKNEKRLLIIDHLHYFARGNKGSTENMDELIASMQMIAKKLEIPIVVVAHLRKLNKDNKPTLDDLKDSSSLAQIPGVVCLMHRDFTPPEDLKSGAGYFSKRGSLFIAKNRVQGKTGVEEFDIADNGEIVFDHWQSDTINKGAEIPPAPTGFMGDFFND